MGERAVAPHPNRAGNGLREALLALRRAGYTSTFLLTHMAGSSSLAIHTRLDIHTHQPGSWGPGPKREQGGSVAWLHPETEIHRERGSIAPRKVFKCAAITESAVCELCHIRFVFKDIVCHFKIYLKDIETVQALYKIKTFNSIMVLHGVCLQEKFYFGKLLFKTPNEAVVESMGSMLQKLMKPERNTKQTAFTA